MLVMIIWHFFEIGEKNLKQNKFWSIMKKKDLETESSVPIFSSW